MNRQPQLMDATRMRDILTPHLSQIRENVFLNNELGIIRGDRTKSRLSLSMTIA